MSSIKVIWSLWLEIIDIIITHFSWLIRWTISLLIKMLQQFLCRYGECTLTFYWLANPCNVILLRWGKILIIKMQVMACKDFIFKRNFNFNPHPPALLKVHNFLYTLTVPLKCTRFPLVYLQAAKIKESVRLLTYKHDSYLNGHVIPFNVSTLSHTNTTS